MTAHINGSARPGTSGYGDSDRETKIRAMMSRTIKRHLSRGGLQVKEDLFAKRRQGWHTAHGWLAAEKDNRIASDGHV